MARPYRETPEDKLLIEQPFRIYRGGKIDIRWAGGWLTPNGDYHPVDYRQSITHETIAEEHGARISGSGSISTRPPMMRIFDIAEWMRITYHEYSSFCVELKGAFVSGRTCSGLSPAENDERSRQRQTALLSFIRDYRRFEKYFINDVEYDSFRSFSNAIARNESQPRSDVAGFIVCQKAADQGDSDAQLELAERYAKGNGVARDARACLRWYRTAAEGGCAEAQCEMGVRYATGDGVAKNLAGSAEWFQKAAEQGWAPAQDQLGRCLFYGSGVTSDCDAGIEWVQKAISQGYQNGWHSLEAFYRDGEIPIEAAAAMGVKIAQVDMGLRYAQGIDAPRDIDKALEWMRKGSRMTKDSYIFFDLGVRFADGNRVSVNHEQSAECFRRAVELGDLSSMNRLALCFAEGKGVAKDIKKAAELFRNAASESTDMSNAEALYQIGGRFAEGNGVSKSDADAFQFYLEAAEQGHPKAQNDLAVFYLYGKGVAKSESQAIRWFRAAAKEGIMEAQANLGNCYSQGNGGRQNDEEAVQWYRKAAAQNYDQAEFCLGECYELGLGVDVDLEQAVDLYEKASLHGSEKARSKLKEIAKRHHSIAKTTSDEIIHKFACEACSNKYYYQQLVRKEERKSSGTDYCSKLDKVTPCPSCGHIQNCMIDLSRDQHLNWLHRLGSFMLLFGLLFLLFTLASSLVFIAFFDWVFASETGRFLLSLTMIIGVLGSSLAYAGEIILRVKGAQSEDYDPNKTTSRRDLKWPMIWMAISVAFVALVGGVTSSHLYDRTGSSVYADVSTVSAAIFVIALVAWWILSLKKAK